MNAWFTFLGHFGVWLLLAGLFFLLGFGVADRLRRACGLSVRWVFPLVWLVNALAGYGLFFAHVAGPRPGGAAAWVVIVALLAATGATLRRRIPVRGWRVLMGISGILVVFGLFYLANLEGATISGWHIELPAARYLEFKLPGDNVIPYHTAVYLLEERWGEALFSHENLAGWQLSDRPPLQTGIYLLVRPLARLFGVPGSLAYQSVGTLLQLAWLPAFWLLAGRFTDARTAGRMLFAVAGCGMIVVNMTYVWPKLLSAGFVLLAIALLLRGRRRAMPRLLLAAAAFGLALLSHGGALFTAPAFGLAFVTRWKRKLALGIASGLGVAILVLGPWSAFQKTVLPPGNNLVKWHLAGQFYPDERSLKEALVEGYSRITWQEALDHRWQNVRMLLGWHEVHRPEWYNAEAFYRSIRRMLWTLPLPSAGGLLIGLAGWIYALSTRRRLPGARRQAGPSELGVWAGGSLLFWIALVYEGGEVFMHHGSYATMLIAYLWLLLGAQAAGPKWFGTAAVVQVGLFLLFWWWPGGTAALAEGGHLAWAPLVTALGAYAWLGWHFWKPCIPEASR